MNITNIPGMPAQALAQTYFNDAVAESPQQIKAAKGMLFLLDLVNTVAATSYLQIFFVPSGAVKIGQTRPDLVIRLGTSASKTVVFPFPVGGSGSGLTIAGTSGAGNSTGAAISVAAEFL